MRALRPVPAFALFLLAFLAAGRLVTRNGGTMAGHGTTRNRLAGETSPYLLQHAGNPVDWYPWGDEALAKAHSDGKPIFLSIGYAACHWCHVMERESFENPTVAEVLNRHFVSIKVDREERPDLDEIYMDAVMRMTGSGGWPMSVFLTPDGRPFYGGTYFPPDDGHGRPGFRSLCTQIAEIYRTRRGEVESQANELVANLSESHAGGGPALLAHADGAAKRLAAEFDPGRGGFGRAPKFPPSMAILLLLRHHQRTSDAHSLEMAATTLRAMAEGGLHDQLGGGFHRYSTDAIWLAPHFEKMLYDQAMLVRAYAAGFEATKDDLFRRSALAAIGFCERELRDEGGGFHSSLDADSDGEEGRFYVWTADEVRRALPADEADAACIVWGVRPGGNWEGKSILHVSQRVADVAKKLSADPSEIESRLARARSTLLAIRAKRVRPALDDKVLASWNGLMIGSLARAGAVFGESGALASAERAARFVLGTMGKDGELRHSFRAGKVGGRGLLEDPAYLAEGLLDLHAATAKTEWLEVAAELAAGAVRQFRDPQGGWFATSDDAEELIVRPRAPYDNAIPSPASVLTLVLARLARITGDADWRVHAEHGLAGKGGMATRAPGALHYLLLAPELLALPAAARASVGVFGGEGVRSTVSAAAPPVPPAVLIEAKAVTVSAQAAEISVRVSVPDGWHVNGHPAGAGLIPIEIHAVDGALILEAEYPQAKLQKFSFAEAEIPLLEGRFDVRVRIRTARGELPAEAKIEVRFQACTESVCLPPESRRLAIALLR